ncbi:hypothetical protein F511_16981 [Dorcoceras hygrometricum]|uniref:Uncharacterized protein n=1 Tax=Dorcoceras hygrometricum TaxID=472368 RepID=A0A2Z7A7Y4_9LAMI|nr:hypothetical protein F511_16981 [Dorcoceras hygrometricum]
MNVNTENSKERYAEIVYGSSKLNLLRLPFFRHGKDPLEDFDYNDPCCNPLLRPAAARTPSIYHCTPARKLSGLTLTSLLATELVFCELFSQLIFELVCTELVAQLDSISEPARRLKVRLGDQLMNQLDVPCTSGSKVPNQLGRPFTVPARYLQPVHLRRPLTVLAWISSRLLQSKEHCDVLSMQMDSDLAIYRTTLVRTFEVPMHSTRCVLGKWVYLVTHVMSLFDLRDVCIAIGSLATLDIPMVVDLIGIYVLKGPYCTLTTTNWFLQALSVIPRGSWGDVARRFTMIRWMSTPVNFTVARSWFARELATGFDDVSYAMSFELVRTQRFEATTDCPSFGFETSWWIVVSADLTSRGNTRRRFDI